MTDNDLSGVADTLTHWPSGLVRMRDKHVKGPDGRCLGTSQVELAPTWPCALAWIAEEGLASLRSAAQERGKRGPKRT